jgi:penicillin-binding protein-related factor A (putative recombinase)
MAITGSELEKLVVERGQEYRREKRAHISRCGVQAVRTKDEWQVIPSLPDFEGVDWIGHQFIFDCKVCSQASFDLSKYRSDVKGARSRQLRHMLERAEFGVRCFFLLHWNERSGKTFKLQAKTFAFPISSRLEFWTAFERGEIRSITREHCSDHGIEVQWNVLGSGRKPRPDFLIAVERFGKETSAR